LIRFGKIFSLKRRLLYERKNEVYNRAVRSLEYRDNPILLTLLPHQADFRVTKLEKEKIETKLDAKLDRFEIKQEMRIHEQRERK